MKLTFAALATLILILAPSARAASRPDLRVSALTVVPAGGSTSTTVANAGRAGARRSVLRLVLSADARRDRRDTVVARANVRGLARGRKARVTVKLALPANLAAYLLACADDLGKVREARETNNCRAARVTAASQPAPAPTAPAVEQAPTPVPAPAPSSCAATDAPDLAHVDSDCDGIDGTAAASIFVSPAGADANPGTQAAPKRTIVAGIAAAEQSGRGAVLIAAGQYPGRPLLVNGISLYGGYDPATWQRSDVNVTAITGAHTPDGAEGLRAEHILDPTTLQRLRISSPNAGVASSYGIIAVSAPRLRLERVEVSAGNGAKGASGAQGSEGADGKPGVAGKGGSCDSNAIGAGGAGGGTAGVAFGGAGGNGAYGSLVYTGKPGMPGWGAVLGGQGGATGDPGKTGENGANGLPGYPGAPGTGGMGGTIDDGFFQSGRGGDGEYGVAGQGGGGGGGGGGQDVWVYYGGGNGGGGGGEGGHGGTGGRGGRGGGGSFGVFALHSPGLAIKDSTITSAAGGHGGQGGYGGQGGAGAQGGAGGKVCLAEVGAGGKGGSGGPGGNGGPGGAGAGGPSFTLYGTGGTLSVSSSILTHGTAGLGGYSGTAAIRSGV